MGICYYCPCIGIPFFSCSLLCVCARVCAYWVCCVCVCVCDVLMKEPPCVLQFHWRHSKFEDIVRWYSAAKTCTLTFLCHLNFFALHLNSSSKLENSYPKQMILYHTALFVLFSFSFSFFFRFVDDFQLNSHCLTDNFYSFSNWYRCESFIGHGCSWDVCYSIGRAK